MTLFHPDAKRTDEGAARIWARYELIYTGVDFGAALCFVIGSVMFFSEAWMIPGTWLFLVGSILFAAKPSLRLAREIQLLRRGEAETLAERARRARGG
ncbi:MAG: YrhK family protein [Pseudomonadota bacterium]|nr:YrhK family protein [Pseudomonadota bacterium]MEE3101464.1 YrhK family protein [Pseudomonadota bacterium]